MNNKKRTPAVTIRRRWRYWRWQSFWLAASALGSTRAALTYFSDNYTAQLEVSHIGVTPVENGKDISSRIMLEAGMWKESQGELLRICLGKKKRLPLGRSMMKN